MRPIRARCVFAISALVAAALVPSGRARAQTASPPEGPEAAPPSDSVARARVRYDSGTRAFGQGRFVEAALEFEAAAAEKASAVALYTAALSWERANTPDRAADDYARTVAISGLPPEQATFARQRLASLESMLGALSVTAPEGWRVELDANTEVVTPAVLHGSAGMHTLVVRPSDGPLERIPVVLHSATVAPMALPGGALPAARPIPGPPGPDLRRGAGLVLLGAAATALLAGGLLGIEAVEARDAYDAAPSQATFDHASHLQTWTNVALVAGGGLVVAGLGLALWPAPRSPATSGTSGRPRLFVGLAPPALILQGSLSP